MLHLFRKYQKVIFWVVTVVVVASFCFFGTYGTMSGQEHKDREIGKNVLGAPVFAREMVTLRHLLETSALDKDSQEGIPNLLNPGVIETDFLSTGLACLLARPYFAELKPKLDAKVRKMGRYQPYVHPHSSEIGFEKLVSLFDPALISQYQLLKAHSDQATMQTFALMCQLYTAQLSLPASKQLRQFLQMQEHQKQLKGDEALARADLSLFGLKTVGEWFGEEFVSLVTGFIFNVAELAQERGYSFGNDEVRAQLLKNIAQGYEQFSQGKAVSQDDVQHYYLAKMRALGVDEQQLLGAWKRVMLFKKFFDEASHAIVTDPLALQQLSSFASESVEIDLYQLPKRLQFSNFLSVCKFQLYLDELSGNRVLENKTIEIPSTLLSLAQLQKRSSEFVEQRATVEYRVLTLEDMVGQISLKETLAWQIKPDNFERLRAQFPSIRTASSDAERIAVLNQLPLAQRTTLDQWSQETMAWQDQERTERSLAAQPLKTVSGNLLSADGLVKTFVVGNRDECLSLLQNASLKTEAPNDAAKALQCYKVEGKRCYQIAVVNKEPQLRLVSFASALSEGILDRHLDAILEKGYPAVRKKHGTRFHTPDGGWKNLADVKEEVATLLFSDLAMNWQSSMAAVVDRVRERMQQGQIDSLSFVKDPVLQSEFSLEKSLTTVTRGTLLPIVKEELFKQAQAYCSSVQTHPSGFVGFYVVKGRGQEETSVDARLVQELLSSDVKRDVMGSLLEYLHQEKQVNLLYE